MLVALFAVAFAALPPSGETTRIELGAAVRLDVGTLHRDPTGPAPATSGDWVGGGAAASVDVFGRRLIDDDAAPSLQPFLQRVARFHLEGGGGGSDITYPVTVLNPVEPSGYFVRYAVHEETGHGAVGADGYLLRWLYGAMRLGVDYARWGQDVAGQTIGGFGNVTPVSSGTVATLLGSELLLTGSAAVGVRRRDLLLSAGWSVTAFRLHDDAMQVRFWGGAFVAAHAVVRRLVALDARVDVLEGGASTQGAVTVWLRRRYGLSAGFEGGYGAFADSPVVYGRAGGWVGISAWLTPRVEMSLTYAPAWQRGTPIGVGTEEPDWSFVAHTITLTVSSRPALSHWRAR